jgi:hypothetical protein
MAKRAKGEKPHAGTVQIKESVPAFAYAPKIDPEVQGWIPCASTTYPREIIDRPHWNATVPMCVS